MEQCDLDTEESSVLEHKEYAENIGASRDTVKIRKKSTVYGVEFFIRSNMWTMRQSIKQQRA